VLIIVAVVVFAVIHLTPGDPASVMLGSEATPQQIAALRIQMGLDNPLWKQFVTWFSSALVGNFGQSFFLHQPVGQAIVEHLEPTLTLALFAEILAIAIAIPAGILAARKAGSWIDTTVSGIALLGISLPSFLVGLLLVLLFSVQLRILPVGGYISPSQNFGQFLSQIILPGVSLAFIQASLITRMVRSSMLDVLGENYIVTAFSKGLTNRVITFKHALRNAAIPVITVIGHSVGTLIAGAIVVETVFNIPGIGQLIFNSIMRRDYNVIQAVVLLTAFLYVVINLLVDLSYGVLDPRVRSAK
jgi:peptide/nickel transport system permease protein